MDKFLTALLALAVNTPPDAVSQLALLVRSTPREGIPAVLGNWAKTPSAKARVTALSAAWQTVDVTPHELAGMLIGGGAAYQASKLEQQIELVWTGPASSLVATRKTEQALLQVIQAANIRLFVTSFVAYDVASILDALRKAIMRGVKVSMLLEASDQHGGSVSIDAIGKMRTALPQVKLLSWSDKAEEFAGGKVHAKCAVADEHICFISSANLTGHAMEKNIEAGVLITGGQIPRSLHLHLEALETTMIISRV